MKKLSIVLLALLFVTGSVFAAFDISVGGEASASYSYDLEDGLLDYDVDDSDIDFGFNIDLAVGDAESVGEGGVYAVLKASASLSIDTDYFITGVYDGSTGVAADDDGEDGYVILKSSGIDEFKIYAGDFIIDFLGWPDEYSKAASWQLDDDDSAYDFVKGGHDDTGIAVTYIPLGLTVGGIVVHDENEDLYYEMYAGWKGDLAEGLSADFVAGFSGLEDTFNGFDASAAFAYDMDGIAFDLAADMVGLGVDFSMDASLNTVLDLGVVTPALDVYFAHNFIYDMGDDDNVMKMYEGMGFAGEEVIENDIWVKLSVADIDLGFATADVSVYGETLLVSWFFGADASLALVDLPLEVGVNGGIGEESTYEIGADLAYTYDGIKLYAEGSFESFRGADWVPGAKIGVSSSALVDNAVLDLNWESDDLNNNKGAITASVTVSF